MKREQNYHHYSSVRSVCLIGMLMALTLMFKALFNFVPILWGYPIEVYLVIYLLSILVFEYKRDALTFFILCPFVLLIVPSRFVDFGDMLMEYIFVQYVFFPLIFFKDVQNNLEDKVASLTKQKVIIVLFLIFLLFILFTLRLFIFVLAGVIWYTPGDYLGSLVFNLPIIATNYAIITPLFIFCYFSVIKLRKNFYN